MFERLFPSPLPNTCQLESCIWIHAVSVGEVKAVSSLAKKLNSPLIVSSITETGLAEAKRSIPQAAHHLLLPVDLKCIVKPLLKGLKLKALIISETDFWWHFLSEAKQIGAQILLVNGKLSERSVKMRGRFKTFTDEVFSLFDRFFLQSEKEKERFLSLGVLAAKLEVTGNLKFEAEESSSTGLDEFKERLGIKGRQVLVFGSTHVEEEPFLFEVVGKLLEEKNLSILVVPRHPERFVPFYQKLKSLGASLLSEGGQGPLLVVDQMGILTKCYEVADIAIVCGSFAKGIGGHNILEPLFFKVATLFGPFMEGQKGMVDEVLGANGAIQVAGEGLVEEILRQLSDKEGRKALGERGFEVIREKKRGIPSILHFLVAPK